MHFFFFERLNKVINYMLIFFKLKIEFLKDIILYFKNFFLLNNKIKLKIIYLNYLTFNKYF
jgi:hypothetical protein